MPEEWIFLGETIGRTALKEVNKLQKGGVT